MKRILHLSDLHLQEDNYPEDKLNSLITTLEKTYTKIDILVLTGDIKNWDQNFNNPIRFINQIVEKLKINDVIMTPGNHDVLCNDNYSLKYNISKGECNILRDINATNGNFDLLVKDFYKACKKIINCRSSEEIQTITIGNINFLTASSVYGYNAKTDNTPFCCNCKQLHKHIQNNLNKYFKKDCINIFVTHTNDEKLCDLSLYNYNGSNIDVVNEINNIFNIKLFGHVHTNKEIDNETVFKYCVGNENFYCDDLIYNIYNIDESNYQFSVDQVNFKNKKWIIIEAEKSIKICNKLNLNETNKINFEVLNNDFINMVINISRPYLKENLFYNRINLKRDISISSENNSIFLRGDELFNRIKTTNFFKCITKLKKVKTDGVTNKEDIREDLFVQLETYLNESDNNTVPIAIKGNIGTGKTTFLNLFYYYLLSETKNNSKYIPIYIDVPSALTNLDNLLSQINEVSKLNKRLYIILDGMDEKCITCNDYIGIDKLFESTQNSVYLFGINSHLNTIRDKSIDFVSNNRSSKYLLYFNSKSTIPNYLKLYYNKNYLDYKKLIKLYLDMLCISYDHDIIPGIEESIKSYGLNYIDFHLLYYITKIFIFGNARNARSSLIDLLNKSFSDSYKNKLKNEITSLAYGYAYTKNILCQNKSFRAEYLKSQIMVDYLVAKFLSDLINNGKLENTAFTKYYSKNVNYFLVEFIKNGTINTDTFKKTFIDSYENLDIRAKASFLFLMRQIEDDSIKTLIGKQKLLKRNEENDYNLIFNRTLLLSQIHMSSHEKKHEKVYDYLYNLITNPLLSYINRAFNLYYYNDKKYIPEAFLKTNQIDDSNFDFKKSFENNFRIIFGNDTGCKFVDNKIEIKSTSEYQDKIDINVFTIVNILQQRILYYDNLKIQGNKYRLIESIIFVTDFLTKYILTYYRKTLKEKMVWSYYKMMTNDFCSFIFSKKDSFPSLKNKIEQIESCIPRITLPLYNIETNELYNKFDTTKVVRKGWEKECNLKDNRSESVAEHSMSIMTIAFLFLDENKSIKESVLKLAFFNELAAGIVGDKIPSEGFVYNDGKIITKQLLLFLTLIGTYHNHINLSNYFKFASDIYNDEKSEYIQIYNDIKIIQRVLKLRNYRKMGIEITNERYNEFINDIYNIKTPQGNDIKNKLGLNY